MLIKEKFVVFYKNKYCNKYLMVFEEGDVVACDSLEWIARRINPNVSKEIEEDIQDEIWGLLDQEEYRVNYITSEEIEKSINILMQCNYEQNLIEEKREQETRIISLKKGN